jgi:hypothetical protein
LFPRSPVIGGLSWSVVAAFDLEASGCNAKGEGMGKECSGVWTVHTISVEPLKQEVELQGVMVEVASWQGQRRRHGRTAFWNQDR